MNLKFPVGIYTCFSFVFLIIFIILLKDLYYMLKFLYNISSNQKVSVTLNKDGSKYYLALILWFYEPYQKMLGKLWLFIDLHQAVLEAQHLQNHFYDS